LQLFPIYYPTGTIKGLSLIYWDRDSGPLSLKFSANAALVVSVAVQSFISVADYLLNTLRLQTGTLASPGKTTTRIF
jgi:hypothetical protein